MGHAVAGSRIPKQAGDLMIGCAAAGSCSNDCTHPPHLQAAERVVDHVGNVVEEAADVDKQGEGHRDQGNILSRHHKSSPDEQELDIQRLVDPVACRAQRSAACYSKLLESPGGGGWLPVKCLREHRNEQV